MNNTTSNSGIGILGVIGIVLVTLKLVGLINDWSWWLVLFPLYGPVVVLIILFLAVTPLLLWNLRR